MSKQWLYIKKKTPADKFLVEKKNPLILPPDYGKLPIPQNMQINNDNIDDEEIKILISNKDKNSSSTIEKKSKSNSIEKSILEKIK